MPETLPTQKKLTQSPLFTLRAWQEDLGGGKVEWRGKIQDVKSGEIHYFRDWYTLIESLQEMLKAYNDPFQGGS